MIVVEAFKGRPVPEWTVEIVERKGTGHPDYICDSVMEAISVALSKEYKRAFGAVLHHNIDKGLLAAGRVIKRFGGGRVIKPMELIIGDRATFIADGKKIPVVDIAVSTAKRWLRENLRFVDPDRHIKFRSVLAPGSEELADIFLRPGAVRGARPPARGYEPPRQARPPAILGANDTSAAVGYYPLSPTEETVLKLERYLNSKGFKNKYPETGEDIKVMALRTGRRLDLTVAMPLLCGFVSSEADYFEKKGRISRQCTLLLAGESGFEKTEVHLNTLDEKGRGLGGVYLSLLGTSAEDADSGQVGRGNRVNGLISINRPMGTEAAAGKNPVSHVGKIYNVLAHKAAGEIYGKVEGVREVYVLLLSRIGAPIDKPLMASARLILERGVALRDVSKRVSSILEERLSKIAALCDELAEGKYKIC